MQPEMRHEAASAYAARLGMTEQAFLEHVEVTSRLHRWAKAWWLCSPTMPIRRVSSSV